MARGPLGAEASPRRAALGHHVLRSASLPSSLGQGADEPPGRTLRGGIPGYTGHVPGRTVENIFGMNNREAGAGAALAQLRRGRVDSGQARARSLTGNPSLPSGSIDRGCLNSTVGSSAPEAPPECQAGQSWFRNPHGHGCRSGAGVPGYAGYIPGKKPGSVCGTRFCLDNLEATSVRKRKGYEWTDNMATECELERSSKAIGANLAQPWPPPRHARPSRGSFGEATTQDSRQANGNSGSWRLFEPYATHEVLRY